MSRRPNSGRKPNLSQFGLIDIPDINDDEPLDLSDDDFDLEAELAAISGGGGQRRRPKKPPPLPAANLDAMIAESLKDIPTDDEGSGDEDDDPDLLNELQALAIDDDDAPPPPPRTSRPAPPPPGASLSTDSSTVSLLQDRITNYTVAEQNAKSNGESSRARRFARGLKTLEDLLKQAKSGKIVKNEDIPPPVAVGKPAGSSQTVVQPEATEDVVTAPPAEPLIDLGPSEPSPPEPTSPPPSLPPPSFPPPSLPEASQVVMTDELKLILNRKNEFKVAALHAKKRGDKFLALELLKVNKQFDIVVDAYNKGEKMDLNELPTVDMITQAFEAQKKGEDSTQGAAAPPEDVAPSDGGMITATTLAEGLQQRLEAFRKQEAKAQEEGNSSKARRMNRIIKQYLDAIKQHAAGRPINVDELPTPAGYGPLPKDGAAQSTVSPRVAPAPPAPPAPPASPPGSARGGSRLDKQLALLLKRQRLFKEAALVYKKKGDLDTAKNLLRTAKCIEPLIEAARAGQPVDLTRLPKAPVLPPESDTKSSAETSSIGGSSQGGASVASVAAPDVGSLDDYALDDEAMDAGGTDEDVYTRLLQQLNSQVRLCRGNMNHNKKMGNIAEEKKFADLLLRVTESLDVVEVAKINKEQVPKFHFEMRQFSVVQCNTDLNENDLELTIVRGIAFNVPNPKEVDTYVKFEFPFPQEAPVTDRTAVIKDTNSPEYNAVFPLAINRTRACLRVFKRHGIKLEVWSRGGWFRSDALLGTVTVKLAPLQEHVTLHDSFPLTDGRRPAGGSLEIKLRVRTPLLQPEVKTTQHRWLVID